MIILDARSLHAEEQELFDFARAVDSGRAQLISRRSLLGGMAVAPAGVIMPSYISDKFSASASVLDLIKAFIQGGINLINEIIRWGEQIIAIFKIVNDSAESVAGYLNRQVIHPVAGVRDDKADTLEIPPKTMVTLQDDKFTANQDYGEGNMVYKAQTSIASSSAGLKIVGSTSL